MTDSLVEEVHALVRKFSPNVKSPQTDLIESGLLDSANMVRLILAVQEEFSIEIAMEELEIDSFRTVARVADLVRERRAPQPAVPLVKSAAAPLGDGEPGAGSPRPAPPVAVESILKQVNEVFAAMSLAIPEPQQDLFHSGILDSMVLVQLIVLLESHFGLTLSLEDLDLEAFSSTSGIAALIARLTTSEP